MKKFWSAIRATADAHYFLGVAYADLGKDLDARRNYYKILPDSDKFNLRDYGLGLLALSEGNIGEAANNSPPRRHLFPKMSPCARPTLTFCESKGAWREAETERKAIQQLDETNAFAQSERLVQSGAIKSAQASATDLLDRDCAHHPQGYLELATEYFRLSAWAEAAQVLDHGVAITAQKGEAPYPLLLYYRAYALTQMGDQQTARSLLEQAARGDLKIVIFPFRAEDVKVLKTAMRLQPGDANAAGSAGRLALQPGTA